MNDGARAPTQRFGHAGTLDAGESDPPPPVAERRDPAAVEAALLRWATALTKDPTEAQALVAQARVAGDPADEAGPPRAESATAAPLSEAQIFRLLRQSYHSVERTRRRRPMRDAVVTSLAEAAEQRG